MMIPQPCLAFILLYPINESEEKFRADEEESLANQERAKNVFWMKQTIGNACGTIAIIHALANVTDQVDLVENSVFERFLESLKGKTPEDTGVHLESSSEIADLHQSSSTSITNQTEAPNAEKKCEDHFIALVHIDGVIYEVISYYITKYEILPDIRYYAGFMRIFNMQEQVQVHS